MDNKWPVTLGRYVYENWHRLDPDLQREFPDRESVLRPKPVEWNEEERLHKSLRSAVKSWKDGCNSSAWLDEMRNKLADKDETTTRDTLADMDVQELVGLAKRLKCRDDAVMLSRYRAEEKKPLRIFLSSFFSEHFLHVSESRQKYIVEWCRLHPEEAKHVPVLSRFLEYHQVDLPWEEDKSSRPSIAFLIKQCDKYGCALGDVIDPKTGDLKEPAKKTAQWMDDSDWNWSVTAEDGDPDSGWIAGGGNCCTGVQELMGTGLGTWPEPNVSMQYSWEVQWRGDSTGDTGSSAAEQQMKDSTCWQSSRWSSSEAGWTTGDTDGNGWSSQRDWRARKNGWSSQRV